MTLQLINGELRARRLCPDCGHYALVTEGVGRFESTWCDYCIGYEGWDGES
jgi:hypothetical protein